MYCEIKGMMSGTCTASWLGAQAASCAVHIIQVPLTAVCCPWLAIDHSNLCVNGDDSVSCGWLGLKKFSSPLFDVPGGWGKEPVSKFILSWGMLL